LKLISERKETTTDFNASTKTPPLHGAEKRKTIPWWIKEEEKQSRALEGEERKDEEKIKSS
jgi:hypothetical protein